MLLTDFEFWLAYMTKAVTLCGGGLLALSWSLRVVDLWWSGLQRGVRQTMSPD